MKKKNSSEQNDQKRIFAIIIFVGFVLPVVLLILMEVAVYAIARLM